MKKIPNRIVGLTFIAISILIPLIFNNNHTSIFDVVLVIILPIIFIVGIVKLIIGDKSVNSGVNTKKYLLQAIIYGVFALSIFITISVFVVNWLIKDLWDRYIVIGFIIFPIFVGPIIVVLILFAIRNYKKYRVLKSQISSTIVNIDTHVQ